MKKIFSFLFFLIVLVGTLAGCKSASVIPPTVIEKTNIVTTKEVVHDTVFEVKKDSSSLRALLECQGSKVVIKYIKSSVKGNHLQPPKVQLKDNIITVDCEAKAQKLFAKWKDTYISEYHQTTTSKPVLIEKQLSWWQIFQIWCGRIFLVAILILIINYFKPIKL